MKKYDLTAEEMLPGREEEFQDGFELHWTGWKQVCNMDVIVGQWVAWNKRHTYGYMISIPGMSCAMVRPGEVFNTFTDHGINPDVLMCDKALRESLIASGLDYIKEYITQAELNNLMKSADGYLHIRIPKLYSSQ